MNPIKSIRVIDDKLLNDLIIKAKQSPRKRAHFCFHQPQEKVQRMVNVLTKDAYVPPHKHYRPDKVEHFFCVKGKLACINHNQDGTINHIFIIQPQGPVYSVDIPPNTYHMFVCLKEPGIMVEIVEGPYDQATHKKFAPFAPLENDPKGQNYLKKIKQEVKKRTNA